MASFVRKSSVLLIALILLITSTKAVGANPFSVIPGNPESFAMLLLAAFSIFIFNYLVNLGSAALVMKVFGFTVNMNSVNKLAAMMFKVTMLGTILVFLISGSFGTGIYWLSRYGISSIIVGVTEIILLSFLLYRVYVPIPFKKAASISTCAIIFGILIGLPFVIPFLR